MDDVEEPLLDVLGDRAGDPVADGEPVDAADRRNLRGRPGEENFIRYLVPVFQSGDVTVYQVP